jgi:membrane fusion protein, copper/silver efflux system
MGKHIWIFLLVFFFGIGVGKFIFDGSEVSDLAESNEEITYTCSMHPQIRQNHPGLCPLCGMELTPLDLNVSSDPSVFVMTPEAMALANIQTSKLVKQKPEFELELSGKLALNEQKTAVISANFSGRIEELYIDFTGQSVEIGQKLASIYSPDLAIAQKELIEARRYKETQPAIYLAAKDKLKWWKITDEQIRQIEEANIVIEKMDVFADRSGIVLNRLVSKGDFVNKGTPLFELTDVSRLWVLMDAYEADLPQLRIGQSIDFKVNALPNQVFKSNITFIDPMVNGQTRTASVRAEVSNPKGILKPEMFVTAQIKVGSAVSALMIPKKSVLWTGKRSVIYIKSGTEETAGFELREIQLGASAGDFYIVEKGLKEGEEFVSNGVFAVDAAVQLNGGFSMMNQPASKKVDVHEGFQKQLDQVTRDYFEIKNQLVLNDVKLSTKAATRLYKTLGQVSTNALEEQALKIWIQQKNGLMTHLKNMETSKDIDQIRADFSSLTQLITEMVEIFGLYKGEIFVDYCPMAFNDKGGYWLSEFEEIKNPYYGDAMLKCGIVKKKFTF